MSNVVRFKSEAMQNVEEGSDQGYIKLHRKILDAPFWRCPIKSSIWQYLLIKATHRPFLTEFKGGNRWLAPGQLITGRKKILRECFDQKVFEVTEDMVRGALAYFQREGMIKVEAHRSAGSVVTIANWELYQKAKNDDFAPQTFPKGIPQSIPQRTPQSDPSDYAAYSKIAPKEEPKPSPNSKQVSFPIKQEDKNLKTKQCPNSGEFEPLGDEPAAPKKPTIPNCPLGEIQDLYNECLPTMTTSRVLSTKVQGQIRKLWRQTPEHRSLEFWRTYFTDLNKLSNRIDFWSGGGVANGTRRGIDLITREDIFARNINELIDGGIWS